MNLPKDWDIPSKDNISLCERFGSGRWTDDRGNDAGYRYFIPDTDKARNGQMLPLVLFLHGADAFGEDNVSQLSIHDIGTMFARSDWQESDPCFILAPQCRKQSHWSDPFTLKILQSLVLSFISDHPAIDLNRIYVYGYSAGGLGTFKLLKTYPDFYAAAVPICGATGGDDLELLLKTPLWMVHAEDDMIVRNSYKQRLPETGTMRNGFYLGSKDIYNRLKEIWPFDDGRINYTGYPEGWMKERFDINPHCSWVTVSDEIYGKPIRNWLFMQSRRK